MNETSADSGLKRKLHTYRYLSRGVDFDGWWKITLKRDDGREVKVKKARYRQLQREGRIDPDCYGALVKPAPSASTGEKR